MVMEFSQLIRQLTVVGFLLVLYHQNFTLQRHDYLISDTGYKKSFSYEKRSVVS